MGTELFIYLVYVKSARGAALFAAFGKREVRKCGTDSGALVSVLC